MKQNEAEAKKEPPPDPLPHGHAPEDCEESTFSFIYTVDWTAISGWTAYTASPPPGPTH